MSNKTYSRINLFFRALFFTAYMSIVIPPYCILCLLLLVAPLRVRHALIRTFLWSSIFVLKHVCLINYRVTGLENIPKDHVGVVLCKHQSTWETFYLPLIFHDIAIIAKRELVFVPFFGWGMAATDPILINRGAKGSAMQQIITKGKKCLEQGRWIVVFPEGTRIPYGKVGQYKLGGARLAVSAECPVIPVAHNAGKFWPRRGFIKQPGTIDFVIGPVIQTKGRTPEEVMKEASGWIEEVVGKIG